ncbi:cytochrome P450 [Xylariaceae sp. FL0594]|nr:cytochrome P450 [Xylariaceae sp. FL0594]
MHFLELLRSGIGYGVYLIPLYILMLFSYRLLLHPLRHYPGPLAAKLFDGYAAYYSAWRCLHLKTRQNHLQYGPVIRQGPNKLVFNSAQAFHDIYESDRIQKASTYSATRLSKYPHIFNVIDRRAHRVKRRLIGNVLSERSMRVFEPQMSEQIDIFLGQIRKARDTPVNIAKRSKYLALDIVGHLAFGYSLNLQTESTNHYMIGALRRGNYRVNTYMQYPLLATLRLELLFYVVNRMRKVSYLTLLEKMIKARLREDKHAKHDLYSVVADAMDSTGEDRIEESEIWSEAIFFFPAGGESVTTTISSLFFYLSRNPECKHKLTDEIRSTFKSGDDIKGGPVLSGCVYLRACIDEALRMAPPAPGTMWRERCSPADDDQPHQPLIIDGHEIPDGTLFGVNIYTLHHNEAYFRDPFTFLPDRWLTTDERMKKAMNSAFAAFSIGSRGCGGKAMAYLEVSLVIARTLWYFDFERAPGPEGDLGGGTGRRADLRGRVDEYQLGDILTADHDGPNLVFTPRKEVGLEKIGL